MKLLKIIIDLVNAQNSFESITYANCFYETAVVLDEGKTHNGRKEIEQWLSDANERYKATMKPVSFEDNEMQSILKAEISGNFDGSPIVLSYHLEIADGLIRSLRITG